MLGTFQRNQMCPLPNAHASCNTRSLQATGFVPSSDRQEVLYAVKNENAPCDQLTTADNTHTHTHPRTATHTHTRTHTHTHRHTAPPPPKHTHTRTHRHTRRHTHTHTMS